MKLRSPELSQVGIVAPETARIEENSFCNEQAHHADTSRLSANRRLIYVSSTSGAAMY